MKKQIQWDKPIQTRDGRKAEFVRPLKSNGAYTHLVICSSIEGGNEIACYFTKNGELYDGSPCSSDIINTPQRIKLEAWVNLYGEPINYNYLYQTKKEADISKSGFKERKACVKITIDCEEGEGL